MQQGSFDLAGERMSTVMENSFHAEGAQDFYQAIEKDSAYRKKREAERRQRIESLLTERLEEFQRAGYWQRQAILKRIHSQVNSEFSMAHCLF